MRIMTSKPEAERLVFGSASKKRFKIWICWSGRIMLVPAGLIFSRAPAFFRKPVCISLPGQQFYIIGKLLSLRNPLDERLLQADEAISPVSKEAREGVQEGVVNAFVKNIPCLAILSKFGVLTTLSP